MLYCTNFRLPNPDKLIEVTEMSPGNLMILLESNDPKSNGMLRIETKEKEPEEWDNGLPDLETLFAFDMFSPNMDKKGVITETQTIDNYTVYVAYSIEDEYLPFVKLTAIINLDKTYYLYFNYYGTHYGDEQTSQLSYIQQILKTLQIQDKHAEAIQQIADNRERSLEDRILYHQKNYTRPDQQAKDPFHARYYPEIFAKFQEKVENHEILGEYTDGIYTNARLSIGFRPTEEDDYSKKGNTRFGGMPDLPPNFVWPSIFTGEPGEYRVNEKAGELCEFIAQINCSEFREMHDYFPKHGILYFFVEDHFETKAQVFYYDGDPNELISAKDLGINPAKDCYKFSEDEEYQIFPPKPAKVEIFPRVSILNPLDEEDEICEYPPAICKDLELDRELDPYETVNEFNEELSGYSNEELHAINADVYADYFSPYIYASDSYGGSPQNYAVLLRVAPDPNVSKFDFRAESPIHFVIHKEKLKNLDFSEVYYGYQET